MWEEVAFILVAATSVFLLMCAALCCAALFCVLLCCRIFKIKDPKFAGVAPKVCKPVDVPDEDH